MVERMKESGMAAPARWAMAGNMKTTLVAGAIWVTAWKTNSVRPSELCRSCAPEPELGAIADVGSLLWKSSGGTRRAQAGHAARHGPDGKRFWKIAKSKAFYQNESVEHCIRRVVKGGLGGRLAARREQQIPCAMTLRCGMTTLLFEMLR
jgi:hypothetical protein